MLRSRRTHLGKQAVSALIVQGLKLERAKGGEAGALRADLVATGVAHTVLFPEAEAKGEQGTRTAVPNVEPLRFQDLRARSSLGEKGPGRGTAGFPTGPGTSRRK